MRSGDSRCATCARELVELVLFLAHLTIELIEALLALHEDGLEHGRGEERRQRHRRADERDASHAAACWGELRSAAGPEVRHARARAARQERPQSRWAARSRSRALLYGSQPGALGTRVRRDLCFTRCPRALLQELHRLHRVAHARQAGRAGASAGRRVAKAVLHDAVLTRVVGEHGDNVRRARARRSRRRSTHRGSRARRSPRCGSPGTCASPGCPPRRRAGAGIASRDDVRELGRRLDRTRGDDGLCDASGEALVTEAREDVRRAAARDSH